MIFKPMKGMILAAGYGTRLGSVTRNRPKILVDIGGMTALEWILRKLKASGCDDVIMNTHYLADIVEREGSEIAGRLEVSLSFSDERERLLDTGGGLWKARDFFDDKPFLLYNGDIISDVDIDRLFMKNMESGSVATLSTRERPGERVFLVDGEGYLVGWKNRSTGEELISLPGTRGSREIAFSAVAVLKPSIFDHMEPGIYSLRPVYLELARKGLVDTLEDANGEWIDIGRPEGLTRCRELVASGVL